MNDKAVASRLACMLLLSLCTCRDHAVGADAGTGSGDGGPDLAGARSLFEPLVRAQCEQAFRCCDVDELAAAIGPSVADVETCTQRTLDVMESGGDVPSTWSGAGSLQNLLPFFAFGLDDALVEVDEAAFAACASELANLPCAASSGEADVCIPPAAVATGACDTTRLFVGQRQLGEDCSTYEGVECAPGLSCEIFGAGVGVCIEAPVAGDGCFHDDDCGAPLVCDFATGTCAQPAGFGQACSYADADNPGFGTEIVRCGAGLVCDPISSTCRSEECGFGDYCSSYDGRGCPDGLACVVGRCDFLAVAGEECWDQDECASGLCIYGNVAFCGGLVAAGGACVTDEQCETGYCETISATCQTQLAPGATCDPNINGPQCAAGYCNGVCVAFGEPGDMCPPAQCNYESDSCIDGQCYRYPLPDGVPCWGNYECESGHCSGVCGDPTPIGGACTPGSDECGSTAYCAGAGVCAERLQEGAPCSVNLECWGNCVAAFGELRCSGVGPGHAVCDGV